MDYIGGLYIPGNWRRGLNCFDFTNYASPIAISLGAHSSVIRVITKQLYSRNYYDAS